jgi:ribosome-associated toxin RatA of RatAB toxin-antitoxin module
MALGSTIITLAILIPTLSILVYIIGLLVPESHIVHRSTHLNISSKQLWRILTDVSDYPNWQSKVERVIIEEREAKRTVFVEHSTRKRHTVVIHQERVPNQVLLRIVEESREAAAKISTFSGSWTFEITEQAEDKNQVVLKITEQGVIKKPLVRIANLVLFGFHRRLDQFIKDIKKRVENSDSGMDESLLRDYSFIDENSTKSGNQKQQTIDKEDWDLMSEIYDRN